MRSARLVVLLALGVLAACQGTPPPEPVAESLRRPPAGPVVGTAGHYGGHAWLGIPYAAPPVDELRWRAPRPAERWTEPRESLAFGPRCPQLASGLEGARNAGQLIGEEDCLHLNVYAPAFAPEDVPTGDELLPVMLWIHGGGNTIGASSFYDGSHLASSRGLVVVSVNYRLGPLGWFRHASLRGEGTTAEDRSGNYGTLDLIRSLHWVRENVSAFGGDPDNVTVFGESAGGRNTFTLLISPLSDGLFHRAIVQSGGTGRVSPAEAENRADDLEPGLPRSSGEILLRWARRTGGAVSRDAARTQVDAMGDAEVESLLRGLSVDDLFALYVEEQDAEMGMLDMPRLFQEPTVLPVDEYTAFRSGRYHHVPIVTGTNRDENKLFLSGEDELARRRLGMIPVVRDEERYERIAGYLSRGWKANAVDGVAPLLVAAQGGSVYAYRFDWDELPSVLGSDLAVAIGAAHALEIPFVFGHFDLGRRSRALYTDDNEPGRLALSRAMMSYWAEFAYHGDPGRGRDHNLPAWLAWDASSPQAAKYLVLDSEADGGLRMASETVSAEGLLAELRDDPALAAGERCAILARLTRWYTSVEDALAEGEVRLACADGSDGAAGAAGGE